MRIAGHGAQMARLSGRLMVEKVGRGAEWFCGHCGAALAVGQWIGQQV
jgi:hypothetical protein